MADPICDSAPRATPSFRRARNVPGAAERSFLALNEALPPLLPVAGLCTLVATSRCLRGAFDHPEVWKNLVFERFIECGAKNSPSGSKDYDGTNDSPPILNFRNTWKETFAFQYLGADENQSNGSRPGHRMMEEHRSDLTTVIDELRNIFSGNIVRSSQYLRSISTMDGVDISLGKFVRGFEKKNRPVILRQVSKAFVDQPELWKVQRLKKAFHDQHFHVNAWGRKSDLRMTLPSFLNYVRKAYLDLDPLYLFDPRIPDDLLVTLRKPDFMPIDLLDDIEDRKQKKYSLSSNSSTSEVEKRGQKRRRSRNIEERNHGIFKETRWLLIGGRGSGTRFHFDPHAVSAWSLCMEGKKLWFLWPPIGSTWGKGRHNYPLPPGIDNPFAGKTANGNGGVGTWFKRFLLPLLRSLVSTRDLDLPGVKVTYKEKAPNERLEVSDERVLYWGVQNEGDLVFVPSGWFHTVLNLETSVALTRWFVTSRQARNTINAVCSYDKLAAEYLRRVIQKLHQDDDSE